MDKPISKSSPGDDRTPDKTIGQVKYADQTIGKRGLQDDHDPNDIGQKTVNGAEKSQAEGPAAYAPHREEESVRAKPGDPAKKKTGEF